MKLSKTDLIAYFHSDKKDHYVTKCPKLIKEQNTSRRLVIVLTICTSITEIKEAILQQLPYIWHSVQFRKNAY